MEVNTRPQETGAGFFATIIGAIIGGVIGFLVALVLAGYEIGRGISKGVNSGWTVGHTVGHIVTSIFLGVLITVFGALLIPWLGEVLGSALALRVRNHGGIRHTAVLLAIITPIWSIVAAIVLIVVFKAVPGKQFVLPVVIWIVTLVLVPPIIARIATVAGRHHAH